MFKRKRRIIEESRTYKCPSIRATYPEKNTDAVRRKVLELCCRNNRHGFQAVLRQYESDNEGIQPVTEPISSSNRFLRKLCKKIEPTPEMPFVIYFYYSGEAFLRRKYEQEGAKEPIIIHVDPPEWYDEFRYTEKEVREMLHETSDKCGDIGIPADFDACMRAGVGNTCPFCGRPFTDEQVPEVRELFLYDGDVHLNWRRREKIVDVMRDSFAIMCSDCSSMLKEEQDHFCSNDEDTYITICMGAVMWDKEKGYVMNLKYAKALTEFKAYFKQKCTEAFQADE